MARRRYRQGWALLALLVILAIVGCSGPVNEQASGSIEALGTQAAGQVQAATPASGAAGVSAAFATPTPAPVDPPPAATLVAVGDQAPALNLQDLQGTPRGFADYTGQLVLLNFWASWCGHCRGEVPFLQEAYARYHDSGLEVVAVSVGEPPDTVSAFVAEHDMAFPVLLDTEGQAIIAYQLQTVPTTYVLDRSGQVLEIVRGAFTAESLQALVEAHLGEAAR
ncbi:MAG: TlpA family protein disulfide reductase [Anaerolineae bacterium]|nr:TlpA family protein disulfide reductase [Chloroflexota bacterium]